MDIRFLLFVVTSFLVHSAQGQDAEEPLELKFINPEDRLVTLGSSINLDFTVNRHFMFPLQQKVTLVRILPARDGGQATESELTDAAKLKDGQPEFYKVAIDTPQDPNTLTFTIKFDILSVRDIDDAIFECRAYSDSEPEGYASTSLKVIVIRPNTKLEMQFGGLTPFHESMSSPLEVDSGKHDVRCTAEGSNPATHNIRIFFNGIEVATAEPEVHQIPADLTRYNSTVRGHVEINVADSGQDVECVAISKAKDQLTVKAPIKVKTYDPVVECVEATAFVGKRYPVLSCTVDETGHDITSYGFQFGKTGETIYAGEQNNDFDEVKKMDLEDSKVKVELQLHKTKQSHFGEYYLIINHSNGHITREAVVLTEVEGSPEGDESVSKVPRDSSSMVTSSLLMTLLVCLICAVWQLS